MLPEGNHDFIMSLSDKDVWENLSETTPPVPEKTGPPRSVTPTVH